MSEFISKSDFDDAFETALNREEPKVPTDDWMFEEFPDKYSVWECCIERYEEVSKKARMWDALKHAIENGKWSEDISEHPIVIAMCNIEHEVSKNND